MSLKKYTICINKSVTNILYLIPDDKSHENFRADVNKFRDTLSYSAPEILDYRWSQFIQLLNCYIANKEDKQQNPEWVNSITKIVLDTNSKLTVDENTI
jgi:hypothetical protein